IDAGEDDVAARAPGQDLRRWCAGIREGGARDVGIQAEDRHTRSGALDDEAAAGDADVRELEGASARWAAIGVRPTRADDRPPRSLVVPVLAGSAAEHGVRLHEDPSRQQHIPRLEGADVDPELGPRRL